MMAYYVCFMGGRWLGSQILFSADRQENEDRSSRYSD